MKKALRSYLLISLVILVGVIITLFFILGSKPRLNRPESITYDALSDRFLISNLGSAKILAMDDEGKLSHVIKKGLRHPRGIKMRGQELLVADDDKLHFIDPQLGFISKSITIDGAQMLNDVEVDELGAIYITDTKAECLWKLESKEAKAQKFSSKLMKQPNGIYFDRPRRQMFIVSMGDKQPILAFHTKNQEFSIFKDTIYSELDGIQADELGRIFFSSWKEQAIYMIPQEQNRFIIFEQGLKSPADMYWHEPTNELLIPLMQENRILRLALED